MAPMVGEGGGNEAKKKKKIVGSRRKHVGSGFLVIASLFPFLFFLLSLLLFLFLSSSWAFCVAPEVTSFVSYLFRISL
jgi:hypothetical protein